MNSSSLLSQVSLLSWQIIRPSSSLVFILLAGMLALLFRRRRVGLALAGLSSLALAATLIFPLGHWAMASLEQCYPPARPPSGPVDGIIVLGGGVSVGMTQIWGQPTLNDAGTRMTEFVALARRHPDARLIFTGGGTLSPRGLREADVAARLFDQLGLPPGRVMYERESRNTWENAVMALAIARPAPGERWLLVTSAFHMPRAFASFETAGWTVVPWPVDFHSGTISEGSIALDLPGELRLLDNAVHEWIGMVVYRLAGRTTTLLRCPKAPEAAPPPG